MVKTGQNHMLRSMKPLLERIEKDEIDPSFIITHRPTLKEGPETYRVCPLRLPLEPAPS